MPATLAPPRLRYIPECGMSCAVVPNLDHHDVVASAIREPNGDITCEYRPGYRHYLVNLIAILRDRK